jgi:hypothetical protein
MANGFVQLPDDAANTGKKEDHFVIANGNYREAVVIGDPTTTAAVAPVSATLGLGVNMLDGSSVTIGAVADASVVGDNTGTVSAKLRGLNKILNDVWDSTSHFFKVSIQNTTVAVTVPALAVSAAVTSVNDQATNATLLSLNAVRKGYKLYNDSTQIAYVKEGTTATTSDYSYQIQPLGYYESVGVGIYTGRIDCIWAADGSGAMKITELS